MKGRMGFLGLTALLGGALACTALALGGGLPDVQPTLRGDLNIHDPTVLRLPGGYVAMGTGYEGIDAGTLRLKTSADGVTWADAGHLGNTQPAWVAKVLGETPPNLWAPSLYQRGSVTYLYYSASTFGKNTSGIGLMTHAKLDPKRPSVGWVDRGLVLSSKAGDSFNAIDPARLDTADGRAWLAYGSWWDGIRLRELDPVGGLVKPGTSEIRLASRGGRAIEAPSLVQHGGYTYLFVSFDRCCAGLSSTYQIMVGRSRSVTGPYLDRAGRSLLEGGGTEIQASKGRFVGPGGQEMFRTARGDALAYHFYDGDQGGTPILQTSPIVWGADGWPTLPALPLGETP
ncbi:arabinan endo-1,5-alpha-L-arabinosidase [Deinococcus sp. QL22]|uniref:arabinan endo-1,5-alpha-L-arabinosidase n=1 Tax=Deinococcus sp. QL22 TaxID=2939437 RepID=UPI002017B0FA|nr:arabinan endo-1,5-alpha-L-arabinosidase [Deinococcus sp. QL22]UQN08350.1 arabinan endo-1,5-alpha-L-arabinosidase [Deinococcus sp. QL22]